jgi:hypothetical protein
MTQENNVGRQSKLQRRGNGGAVEMYVVKLEGTNRRIMQERQRKHEGEATMAR